MDFFLEKIVYVNKNKTYTQKEFDVKEYKASYYIKNHDKYTARNKLYREKQKAIKAGTYVEPEKVVKDYNFKINKNVTLYFM